VFTSGSLCTSAVEELARWNRETPLSDEEMWSAVSDNFKESLRMLDDMLREAGIDPAEVEAQPEIPTNPIRKSWKKKFSSAAWIIIDGGCVF